MNEKNSNQDISGSREYILETTQEEYDEIKARGIDEDAIPSVGKHVFRRRTRKINPRERKIKMPMFIDGDILMHFRKRAAKPNAAPYQTQINQELRAGMERDLAQEENNLDAIAKRLVSNPAFLNAISEKLKAA